MAMGSQQQLATDRAVWLQAQQHLADGRLDAAQAAFGALLERHPALVPARLLSASIMLAKGRLRDAAEQTRSAALAVGGDIDMLCRVAQALMGIGETNAARTCLRHPAVAASRSARALVALAHVHQGLGQQVEALALMERARALGHDDPDFHYYLALQLQFNGRLREAEQEMQTCLAKGSTIGRAALSLARIRRQTPSSNHIDALHARLSSVSSGTEDHASLAFALHKELDDLGRCDEAWDALQAGNAVMRKRMSAYDPVAQSALFEGLIAQCDAASLAPANTQPDGPVPIFIVGLPRSGTTLLERILGNHSMVAPAGELNDFPRQLRWAADCHGQAVLDAPLLARTRDVDYAELGRRYLEQSQWRAGGRRFYIDKLPPNFMLLGFIRRALPQAKVIHMVREPMDVCFSNYRAMFGDAYGYSYDFTSLADHHRQYRRLMRHWHTAMPGFVLDLPYELLVRDSESAARRLFDFCGLPFEHDCGDNTRSDAPVATLSSAQVRQPIHARGIGEWRRYEHQFEPLHALLRPTEPGIVA